MKNHLHIYFLLSMVAFCTTCGQSQTDAPEAYIKSTFIDTVRTHGPINTMVRNVKQARNGDILIASFKGVWRYDGKAFTNITSRIPSPSFWDVLEDRKGNLWFATRDSGVYKYNGASFQHFTTKNGLLSNYGTAPIYEDKAGNIWVGTQRGASRYDGKSFQNFTTMDGLSNNDINTIMEDKTGKLWFGTRGDACYYDGKTFTIPKSKDGKPFYNVWGIAQDSKGNIWLGNGGEDYGLWRYDGSTYTQVSNRGAYAIIQDKQGNIWTTGSLNPPHGNWALTRYEAKTLQDAKPTFTEIISLKGTPLCGILEANDGSIWFGSMGLESGVNRYDGKNVKKM